MKRQKVIIVAVLTCMIVSLLSFSVLAAVELEYQVPYSSVAPAYDHALPVFDNRNGYFRALYTTSSGADVVACSYPPDSVSPHCIVMSTVQGASVTICDYRKTNFEVSSQSTSSLNLTYSEGGVTYYYADIAGYAGYDTAYNVIESSQSAALSRCVSALNYTPSPDPSPDSPTSFSIVVPAGYALVIDSSSGFDGTFSCFMPTKNILEFFYSEYGSRWWPGSPVKFALSSAPFNYAVGSTLPPGSADYVPWRRVNPDLLGQTKSAVWTSLIASAHFVLYNPATFISSTPLRPSYQEFNNTPITVTINSISPGWSYTLYELSDRVVSGLSSAYISSTVTAVYDMDDSFYGGFVDSSGSPVVPVNGGAMATDNDQQVTLDGFVSDLDSFFRGTWGHIKYLLECIGNFPAFVVQLYGWLPGEFRAVLVSAFSVVMVVGVLKVML